MFAVDPQASGLSIFPDRIQVSLPTSGVFISFLKLKPTSTSIWVIFHQNGN
jgi:hypothetical protein